jgi:hypothetical protein
VFERLMNAQMSSEIVEYLRERRRWSLARIARTIGAPQDFVRRVRDARQSLSEADLQVLAGALKVPVHRLIFDSIRPEKMSPKMRELYEATRGVLLESDDVTRLLRRKPARKRRPSTKAA